MSIRQIWNRIKDTGITPFLPFLYSFLLGKYNFLGLGCFKDNDGSIVVGPLPVFLFIYGLVRVVVHIILYEGVPFFSKQTQAAKVFFNTFAVNDGTLSFHNCNATAKWELNEVKNGRVELYSSRGDSVTNVDKMYINDELVETSARDRLKIRTFILETIRSNRNSGNTSHAQSLINIAEARQGAKEARLKAELAKLVSERQEREAMESREKGLTSSDNSITLLPSTKKAVS